MQTKSRAYGRDLSELPDWLLADIGINRSDLSGGRWWYPDPYSFFRSMFPGFDVSPSRGRRQA